MLKLSSKYICVKRYDEEDEAEDEEGGGRPKKNQKYGFFQNKITFTLDDYKWKDATWRVCFGLKKVLTIFRDALSKSIFRLQKWLSEGLYT